MSDPGAGLPAFRRDILPHLPADKSAAVVDLGCGQGELVRQLIEHGYTNAEGIDVSPEQVALANSSGLGQVRLGDYRDGLGEARFDVVTATDFFEHLNLDEALEAADRVRESLRPGGRLILRVPNAVSPFMGNYQYGDLTHETLYNERSLQQLASVCGFADVTVYECQPPVHGAKSLARSVVWKAASGAFKLALAAETGTVRGHRVTQNIVAVFAVGR